MDVSSNNGEYKSLELTLTYALIRFIKEDLEAAGLPREQVRKLTTGIAFRVASILDDTQIMYQRSTGKRILPVVMFSGDGDYQKLLTHGGVHSSMHDYVHGIVDQAFKASPG